MSTRSTLHPMFTIVVLVVAVACSSSYGTSPSTTSTTTTYKATLVASNEVPANASPATGTATITVDSAKNLTYTVTFSSLTTNSTAAHIHAPALPGANAAVIFPLTLLTGVTSGTGGPTTVAMSTVLTGTINADSLIKLMNTGYAYVNVHTTQYPGGEIRGWLTKQ